MVKKIEERLGAPVDVQEQKSYVDESKTAYGVMGMMPKPVRYGVALLSTLGVLGLGGCSTIGKVNGVDVYKTWCKENPGKCAAVITATGFAVGGAIYAIEKNNDDGSSHSGPTGSLNPGSGDDGIGD